MLKAATNFQIFLTVCEFEALENALWLIQSTAEEVESEKKS